MPSAAGSPPTSSAQDQTSRMERVLVRPPDTSAALAWQEYCWRAELDVRLAVAEHEVFCTALRGAGVEVIVATSPVEGDPDGIYVYDRGRC